ncbi:MAG: RNA polymerase sigma factor [Cyclobacteriaceae bacterium]
MRTTALEEKIISLSDRIYPMVARMLGNNENAEDAVQEIIMKLWGRRKQLESHPNLSGYAFLTARNYCLDLLKKKNLEVDSTDFPLKIVAPEKSQHPVEWKELMTIVEKHLEELPADQRQVMVMRDIDGFEFTEIAKATKLKVEHVRVLLSRARKQIRLKLIDIYRYE